MKKPKWKHREAARLMRRKKSSRSEERRTAVEAPVREPVHPAAQEENAEEKKPIPSKTAGTGNKNA